MAASAITATETQYPVLINGFLCYSAAEVRAARQLVNPRTVDETTANSRESATTSTTASFVETLRTYTAQGTRQDEEDEDYRQRGSLVNIVA